MRLDEINLKKGYRSRRAGDYRPCATASRVRAEQGKPAKKAEKEKSMRYRRENRRAWITELGKEVLQERVSDAAQVE